MLQQGEPVPLVLLDDPSPFRDMVLAALNEANIPWRLAYVASTLRNVEATYASRHGMLASLSAASTISRNGLGSSSKTRGTGSPC